jgi:hypothetical protein
VCLYLVLEYVRPQQVYPVIDVLPWSQTAIIGTLIALLLEKGRLDFATPISGGLAFYTGVVVLSSAMAYDPAKSWGDFIPVYFSWIVIYVLIINTVTTERRYFVFLVLFLLCSFKMSQAATRQWVGRGFRFQDWGVAAGPGWFNNSGEFGIQMCIFIPLSVYFLFALRPYVSRWKYLAVLLMPISALMGTIASSSRGALLGVGLVGTWMVARSRYRVRAAVLAAVAAVAVVLAIPAQSKTRFTEMGDDYESIHRLTIWKYGIQMAQARPVLGVGFHNFPEYVVIQSKGAMYGSLLPHNIFIEAWAEMGYVGLFAFLTLIGQTLMVNSRTRRIASLLGERGRFLHFTAWGLDGALIGFLGSGFFVTVLYYPYLWINLAMTASLHIAARDTLRRERNRRAHVESRSGLRTLPSAPIGGSHRQPTI